jgi:hypothetical protein
MKMTLNFSGMNEVNFEKERGITFGLHKVD